MARIIAAFTQFFDNAGKPLINGKLQFLESGSNNTDKTTFKDAALTDGLENTNPVILDGAGRLAFSVFGSGVYNVILFDSNGAQIQQFDPVGATSNGSQFSEWLATQTYDKGDIVRATDGDYYQSFINSNDNKNPTSSQAEWDLITIVKSYIANAAGTADVITADFVPIIHTLVNNTRVLITATGANTVISPTFAPNGLTAKAIVKNGDQPLAAGDIAGAGFQADMVYRSGIDKWELLNPAIPAVFVADAGGTADVITATFSPAVTALTDGLEVRVRAKFANATTTPTINYNGLGDKVIVKNGNQALGAGDIPGPDFEMQLVYNSGNDNVELMNPSSVSALSTSSLLHIQDQKPSGTNGGTFSSGAWQTRDLNTELTSNIEGASLNASTGEITLPAGTYFIESSALALTVNVNATRIRDTTNSIVLLSGTSSRSASSAGTALPSNISGTFTLSGITVIELQHRCQTSASGDGFGDAAGGSFSVVHELYTDIKIWAI